MEHLNQFLNGLRLNKAKIKMSNLNTEVVDNLFTTFQTVVHLSEDLKSNHVFTVMGASVNLINPFLSLIQTLAY